ncbi:MAG: enoyl-CoA hydratase/isomerase family protein, partial [Bordetella sp.]|nr:enoyl-CoA hydratase/isomerase family protein [Bordetella sp.]
MSGTVAREDANGVCTLTLERPDKRNALTTAMFVALDGHLAALETQGDTVGCVVLRGAGASFCAGADIAAMQRSQTAPDPRFKSRVIERLSALPQPVVAAVQGHCFTGGLELALAADFILAAPDAHFADTHGRWGLVAGWGMSQRLPRRIGVAQAKRMMFTAAAAAAIREEM